MLIGSYNHSIDAKGRVFIPKKWRDDLGECFIVTKGMNNCLLGMSMDSWRTFADKAKQLPLTDKTAQDFKRTMFPNANDCELDKQGRILLPAQLRDFAGLDKDVTVIGLDDRIEIWDSAAWDTYNARISQDYDAILANMAQQGI
jgi:MraZ protein